MNVLIITARFLFGFSKQPHLPVQGTQFFSVAGVPFKQKLEEMFGPTPRLLDDVHFLARE